MNTYMLTILGSKFIMTIEYINLPREITSHILSFSTNTTDGAVCKDWLEELKYQGKITLRNPDKFIEELHPNIKFLLSDHDHRMKILELIGKRIRLDLLDTYKDYFTKDRFLEKAFEISCLNNHMQLIEFFISKGYNNWSVGRKHAEKGGHTDLINFFLYKSHKDWVDFFIEKGANNWNLERETRGGHKDLVDFFISKGANK